MLLATLGRSTINFRADRFNQTASSALSTAHVAGDNSQWHRGKPQKGQIGKSDRYRGRALDRHEFSCTQNVLSAGCEIFDAHAHLQHAMGRLLQGGRARTDSAYRGALAFWHGKFGDHWDF